MYSEVKEMVAVGTYGLFQDPLLAFIWKVWGKPQKLEYFMATTFKSKVLMFLLDQEFTSQA